MEDKVKQTYLEVLRASVASIDRQQSYKVFADMLHENSGRIIIADLFDLAKLKFGKNPYRIISSEEADVRIDNFARSNSLTCEIFPVRDGAINLLEKLNGSYLTGYVNYEESKFAQDTRHVSKDAVTGVSFINTEKGASSPISSLHNCVHGEYQSRSHPVIGTPSMNSRTLLEIIDNSSNVDGAEAD